MSEDELQAAPIPDLEDNGTKQVSHNEVIKKKSITVQKQFGSATTDSEFPYRTFIFHKKTST